MQPSRCHRRNTRVTAGFTLIELMIVVLIIGVLSAIAIPAFSGYLNRSKTTEAVGFLANIKARQEAYRSEYHQYCDASSSDGKVASKADAWWPSNKPGSKTLTWNASGIPAGWSHLGASPGNQTLFSYVSVAGAVGTKPTDNSFSTDLGYDGTDFWFVSRALGDLDGDNTMVTFESYSHNRNIWISETKGWE
jgi:prepilin-type N-terminal cleavage/methylation domain-containing protein